MQKPKKRYPVLSLNSRILENVNVYLILKLEKQLQCKEFLFLFRIPVPMNIGITGALSSVSHKASLISRAQQSLVGQELASLLR